MEPSGTGPANGWPRLAGFFFEANRRFRGEADVCRRRASPAPVADDPKRTSVALINGWRAVKSFRCLLTDPCELNILLRRPGWREIGCSSIDNVVLDPGVHDSSYACYGNERGQSQSGYRRHDRQRARVVRFRRLRVLRHDDVAALLPRRRQDRIAAQGLCCFGVGFVMRPVGSVLFGIYGDRFGRRLALSAVIFLMAFSTVAIGLLPTYAQAGVLAPILLVVFRLLQGLSAGGEWGGSTSYIVEYAPEGRRGFIGSWQQVSVGSGFLLGSLSAALLSSSLSTDAFISWGWRIPFLLGILVGVLGAYLRWRLNDTPKFSEIAQHGEVAKAPLIEALTTYRREALTIFGLTLHTSPTTYRSST